MKPNPNVNVNEQFMDEQMRTLEHMRTTALDMALMFGPRLLVAIAIFACGYVVSRWASRLAGQAVERFKLEPPVELLLVRIVQLVVLSLFAIIALQNLGVELLPLIAGLGVAGAGVALAMQGILGNVAAGMTIIFTQPFHVGDYLSIGDEEGEVLEITLFSTTLGHPDRSRVIIPNRKIVGEIMHNYGKIRQLDLRVGVAYGSDMEAIFAEIEALLRRHPLVLQEPTPVYGIHQFGDFSVEIGVNPWVHVPDYMAATSDINRLLLETFRGKGIEIPMPQREVHLRS